MNKQLIDQVSQAMQAQQETIARQNLMLDQQDQDIAALRVLLKKLAHEQTEKAKTLPVLLSDLSNSISLLIKKHQPWSEAQAKIQNSQKILTKELLALSQSQKSSINLMTNYQNALPSLTTLSEEVRKYERELQELSLSQGLINTQLEKLSDILK